jgi:hypothetical protein
LHPQSQKETQHETLCIGYRSHGASVCARIGWQYPDEWRGRHTAAAANNDSSNNHGNGTTNNGEHLTN